MRESNWSYFTELDLMQRYGDDAICGYLRSPELIDDRTIEGLCILTYQRCKRSLPMGDICREIKKRNI